MDLASFFICCLSFIFLAAHNIHQIQLQELLWPFLSVQGVVLLFFVLGKRFFETKVMALWISWTLLFFFSFGHFQHFFPPGKNFPWLTLTLWGALYVAGWYSFRFLDQKSWTQKLNGIACFLVLWNIGQILLYQATFRSLVAEKSVQKKSEKKSEKTSKKSLKKILKKRKLNSQTSTISFLIDMPVFTP